MALGNLLGLLFNNGVFRSPGPAFPPMPRILKNSAPDNSTAAGAATQGGGTVVAKATFIDLFCGCGGFTLGMQRAGFHCLAAIDFNAEAVATLKANLSEVQNVLERDLTKFSPVELANLIGTDSVDVIVGGPPCQGFSTARQVDGSNHGKRLKADPRRVLFREFLRYVEFFQPRVFVMENVLGIRTAAGGEYFTRVQKEARDLGRADGLPGYRVHGQIEDAWELGVPQKRRRQLIIGVRNDLPGYFLPELKAAPRAEPGTTLGAVICDLPILRAGGGEDESDYDHARRERHLQKYGGTGRKYLFDVLEIDRADKLTNHTARPHSDRDLRDFERLKEGENSATAIRDRGIRFEFPYDKSSFKDRYTRQSRYHPCSTIVAHLSKDGLMFIHPTQNRSLTPREAARVQSFPDWFRFPKARTHAFRIIGNAVPPLISEAIGLAVKHYIESTAAPASTPPERNREGVIPISTTFTQKAGKYSNNGHAPLSQAEAALELLRVAVLERRALRLLSKEEFLRGWYALLFLFPGLHPDNALDHGHKIEKTPNNYASLAGLEEVMSSRYVRSGWPVALEPVGREAWRRYDRKELADDEFYCVEVQRAGLLVGLTWSSCA